MRLLIAWLVLLALLILAALAWTVTKAWQQHEQRLALDHRLVAERIFDEMDRSLTLLVHREEMRPVLHYRYFYHPDNLVPGSVGIGCSPLATAEQEPYILGYLQWEPDGTVTSPRVPTNDILSQVLDLQVAPAATDFLASMQAWSQGNGALLASVLDNPSSLPNFLSNPINQVTVDPEAADQIRQQVAVQASTPPRGTSEVQEDWNRSVKGPYQEAPSFSKRQQKLPASSAYDYQFSEGNLNQQLTIDNAGIDAQVGVQTRQQGEAGQAQTEVDTFDLLADIESNLGIPSDQGVDITVGPFEGRSMDERRFLLLREVAWSDRLYLQGIVVDLPLLAQHLEESVLGGELQDHVAIDWHWPVVPSGSRTTPPPPARVWSEAEGGYRYQHRFPAPFTALSASSVMGLMPGSVDGGIQWVIGLSLAMAVVMLLGFVMLGRGVMVRLEYARRRQDFVAAVSHELRTPLTSIRMYGEMLRDGMVADADKRQRYHATITSEGERLSRLIDNVLELARLERGEKGGEVRVGSLQEILDEVVDVIGPHAATKGFTLAVDLPEDLPPVRCDRDGLVQALLNLIDNSLKFAREAEQRTIRISAAIAEAGTVRLEVRDFGPGVPRRNLRRVLEPFHRGENELTRSTTGTGIGLALVRQLIQRMDGQLQVDNHPEGGFRVAIVLARG